METTLQVPMSKNLKESATLVAHESGFSSLQEAVRLILVKLAKRQIGFNIVEQFPVVSLSKKNERRYAKMENDFKSGRGVASFPSVAQLMEDLRS